MLRAQRGQIGSGFGGTLLAGHEHNDEFYIDNDGRTRSVLSFFRFCENVFSFLITVFAFAFNRTQYRTRTNRSGGVQGGISNGENLVVRVAFKPTSTIGREQRTVTRTGKVVLCG